jgi:hypothetical protein
MPYSSLRFLLMVCFLALFGCGGGGGGGSSGSGSSSSPTGTGSGAVAPNGQVLTLVSLNLKASDVVVSTVSSSQPTSQIDGLQAKSVIDRITGFVAQVFSRAVPIAVAQTSGYPPAQTYAAFQASRKLLNGQLFKLDPVVKVIEVQADGTKVEKIVTCDLSTAEVRIDSLFLFDSKKGDVLINAQVPDKINPDCVLSYRQAVLVVSSSGVTFEVTKNITGVIKDVIPANDSAFNISETALLIDSSGDIRVAEFPTPTTFRLTDLTTASAPVETSVGSLAFDGKYLFASSRSGTASTATFFVYEKGSTAFKIFRPGSDAAAQAGQWGGNGYLHVSIDDQSRFIFHEASLPFYALNPVTLKFEPAFASSVGASCPTPTPCAPKFPSGMYGARGRYKKNLLSDRGVLWNYETLQSWCLMGGAVNTTQSLPSSPACMSGGAYSRLSGQYVFTVNSDKSVYLRFDVESGKSTVVNLDSLGYLAKNFTIYSDIALVEVVNSANSDRKYVEIDWASGKVTDRGVIASGARKVVSPVPLGG